MLMGSSFIAAMVLIVVSGDTSGLVPMAMVAVVVGASLAAASPTRAGLLDFLDRPQHLDRMGTDEGLAYVHVVSRTPQDFGYPVRDLRGGPLPARITDDTTLPGIQRGE
ncbi:hypothetical protein NIBR502772_17605 [Pseudarthrobacter sp. NIBRBAC000502772]|uniref:hypothetical protein n=1 Tax=Pseudarthrobacter sp. NIBRBAC000502772 TaxID=2590775 RepID=UPI001130A25E|nr:hypothetical protein [Pseudarthrobacter sp. NIBRBAC000502772]QDG67770.1 hypothetical protein NIBR502772_17605 [Pseudarthrobacter sp. NIBRBAC000502772]